MLWRRPDSEEMPSPAVALFSKMASMLITFAGLIIVATIIAFFAARKWGAGSRRRRQAIYSIVGVIGIVAAGIFTQYRIRHLTQ
jgi:hypothetical protein